MIKLIAILILLAALVSPPAQAAEQKADASPSLSVQVKLMPGSKLAYNIAQDPIKPQIPADILVNARGEAVFPVSGGYPETITLQAAGKTVEEVRTELKKILDSEFYNDADVSLNLKEQAARPGQVLLFGSVRNSFVLIQPGETKRIFEAILQAGPNEFANLKKVKLNRINPTTGKLETQIINVEAIKKDPTKDIQVFDGDRIEVPERGIVF